MTKPTANVLNKPKSVLLESGKSIHLLIHGQGVFIFSTDKTNIDFIISEEIAYIDFNIAEGNAPYIGFQYDPSTCERDVGYYLDAYLHDLRYGGNIETRNVSNYLWIDGIPQIGTDALDPVLATHAFIKALINNFILTMF